LHTAPDFSHPTGLRDQSKRNQAGNHPSRRNEARLSIRSQNKAFENIEHGNSPYFCSHYMMPSTAYLAHPRPISLYSVLDASTSMTPTPTLDLDWEPFQAHIEAFLNAVREHAAPLSFSQL